MQQANLMAQEVLGWEGVDAPPLSAKIVGKMGLRGVSGLNVVKSEGQAGTQARSKLRTKRRLRGN